MEDAQDVLLTFIYQVSTLVYPNNLDVYIPVQLVHRVHLLSPSQMELVLSPIAKATISKAAQLATANTIFLLL